MRFGLLKENVTVFSNKRLENASIKHNYKKWMFVDYQSLVQFNHLHGLFSTKFLRHVFFLANSCIIHLVKLKKIVSPFKNVVNPKE